MPGHKSLRRWLFRRFLSASQIAARASRGFLSVAGGMLSHREFAEIESRSLQALNDEATKRFTLAGFHSWEREIYGAFVDIDDRLLIVGCGVGRDMLPFLQAGHDVVGVEPSADSVAVLDTICADRGYSPTIIKGHIEEVRAPGQFDVVIFSRVCYSCIRQTTRRIDVLRKMRGQLRDGGRVIITYADLDNGQSREALGLRVARLIGRITRSDWIPETNDRLFLRESAGGPTLHYEHWFSKEQIEGEVARAGFGVLAHSFSEGVPVIVLTPHPNTNSVARLQISALPTSD